MRNQATEPLPAIIFIFTLTGMLLGGCSDTMNPPESQTPDGEACEVEVPAPERKACMVNDGNGLRIETLDDLSPLCSTSCSSLAGIGFWKVSGLKDLTTLEGITELGGLGVHRNPDLETLTGLEKVSIQTSIGLYGNPELKSLGTINASELVRLTVTGNSSLRNFEGLESVTSIGMREEPKASSPLGHLEVTENHSLESLDGLENVDTLYKLKIFDNHNLERIDALSKVTYLEGSLSIRDNPSLSSIESLMSIEKIDKSIRIEDNPSLPSCQVQKFLDSVETNENYEVNTGNNGTGNCES